MTLNELIEDLEVLVKNFGDKEVIFILDDECVLKYNGGVCNTLYFERGDDL